jgi:L-ascorbate metabolism protein UlaG (beta-lactamase superfamily)
MFEIEYKGGNSLTMSSKKTTLVVDPKVSLVGLKDLKVKDMVELATEARFRVNEGEASVVIEGPGEYEVGDFTIHGIAATRHIDTPDQEKLATIYRVEAGDVRVALLGNIDSKLSEEQLETLGVVDLLVLPIGGGGYTLDATSAAAIVRQVEPKAVVPIHYADSGLAYEVPQDSIEVFTKELGAPVEQVSKLKLKSVTALPPVLTVLQLARS